MSNRCWSFLLTMGVCFAAPAASFADDTNTNAAAALHHDAAFNAAANANTTHPYAFGNGNFAMPYAYANTSSLPQNFFYSNPTAFPNNGWLNQSSLPNQFHFASTLPNQCWPTQSSLTNSYYNGNNGTNGTGYTTAYPYAGWLNQSSLPNYANNYAAYPNTANLAYNGWLNQSSLPYLLNNTNPSTFANHYSYANQSSLPTNFTNSNYGYCTPTPCSIPGVGGVYTPFFSAGQSSIPGLGIQTPWFSAGQSSIPGATVTTPWFSMGQSGLFSMPLGTVGNCR